MFSKFSFVVIFLFCICGLQCLLATKSLAQDLNNIDKKKPIKITGGFNATQTFYSAHGIENRRDPYYWLLNANINFNLFGVLDIPFSASVSQQNRSYTQPFNQYGISPRYKSITAHIGYRSMQFSNFTLGGNIFLGAGIDVLPKNSWIKGSAMYGRFTKAVDVQETDGVLSGTPAFERYGYGTKITLGRQLNRNIDLIMFHGKDNYSSIPSSIADSFGLKPAENLVLGFVTKQSITEQLLFDLEYSFSAYTEDMRLGREDVEKYKFVNNLGGAFTPTVSTQFNKAIAANLTLNRSLYQLKFSYRRIDPEFKTMGSVFLNNDLEDITGNLGWRMFKNKMNMAVGAGVQRNNLDDNLASKMNRFIGNVNWSYAVSKKLNLNASYSNFVANTKINNTRFSANQLNLNQNVDSLAYNQVTNSASAGINYNAGSDKLKHVVFATGNYQKANDSQENNSVFYTVNAGYQQNFVPLGLNLTLAANYNNSIIREIDTKALGPNVSLGKLLFKKTLRTTFGFTHLRTYTNDVLNGSNTMYRLSNSFKKGKHNRITIDLTYMERSMKAGTGTSYSEFRGSLIYGFTF